MAIGLLLLPAIAVGMITNRLDYRRRGLAVWGKPFLDPA